MLLNRDIVESWDSENRQTALEEAQHIGGQDTAAAALLVAYAEATLPQRQETNVHSAQFDGLALVARLCRFYKGWTPDYILKMHYPLFFKMVREANTMAQEEQRAARNSQGGETSDRIDDPMLQAVYLRQRFNAGGGRVQQWKGEVIPVKYGR